MLKYALLAGAVVMAAPAMAQTATTGAQTYPAPATSAPPSTPATDPMQASPTQTAPAQTAPAQSAPMQAAPTAAPAQTATAEPAASGDQVAQVVDSQFPTYDKDSNGTLSRAEFSAWMVTLKSASDPKATAEAPATKKWIGAAFAQADTDKSKTVSKTELTGFLSQGKS